MEKGLKKLLMILFVSLLLAKNVNSQSSVKSYSNTGNNFQTNAEEQTLTTGDATAKSWQKNVNGQTSNNLEACANDVCVTAQPTGTGSYSVEVYAGGQKQFNQSKSISPMTLPKIVITQTYKQSSSQNLLTSIRSFFYNLIRSFRLKFFKQ